jgi:hypothetical protein
MITSGPFVSFESILGQSGFNFRVLLKILLN